MQRPRCLPDWTIRRVWKAPVTDPAGPGRAGWHWGEVRTFPDRPGGGRPGAGRSGGCGVAGRGARGCGGLGTGRLGEARGRARRQGEACGGVGWPAGRMGARAGRATRPGAGTAGRRARGRGGWATRPGAGAAGRGARVQGRRGEARGCRGDGARRVAVWAGRARRVTGCSCPGKARAGAGWLSELCGGRGEWRVRPGRRHARERGPAEEKREVRAHGEARPGRWEQPGWRQDGARIGPVGAVASPGSRGRRSGEWTIGATQGMAPIGGGGGQPEALPVMCQDARWRAGAAYRARPQDSGSGIDSAPMPSTRPGPSACG